MKLKKVYLKFSLTLGIYRLIWILADSICSRQIPLYKSHPVTPTLLEAFAVGMKGSFINKVDLKKLIIAWKFFQYRDSFFFEKSR